MTPFDEAIAAAESQPRTFVPWEYFWSDRWPIRPDDHLLYFGGVNSVWDACCKRQICDEAQRPYPRLALVAPYLRALERAHPESHTPVVMEQNLLERRPPLYFDRAYHTGPGETLTYMDLDAAYWSIYTRTTLDVQYDGNGQPWHGVIPFADADRLREDKLVRNATLGFLRRVRRRGVDHGVHFTERVPCHKRRPMLWALVMDTLELVMMTARDLGAIYVHTDGAIFPHHDLAEEWGDLVLERFGMAATLRARGEGYCLGLGRWRIGDEVHPRGSESRPLEPGQPVDTMLDAPQHLHDALTAWLSDGNLSV